MYHVTTCALDQGEVEPRPAIFHNDPSSWWRSAFSSFRTCLFPSSSLLSFCVESCWFKNIVSKARTKSSLCKCVCVCLILALATLQLPHFTPHHLQLTLLQHIIIQSPFLKRPVLFLSDILKYWLEDDGTMCLHNSY